MIPTAPKEWNEHDYIVKKVIRTSLDKYNLRVAKHIASFVGWDYLEILKLINNMKDNGGNYDFSK